VPALEGVHELARRVQAAAHQERLLAHDGQGIFQQSCLVLDQRRGCHIQAGTGGLVWCEGRRNCFYSARMTMLWTAMAGPIDRHLRVAASRRSAHHYQPARALTYGPSSIAVSLSFSPPSATSITSMIHCNHETSAFIKQFKSLLAPRDGQS
jgi:hypothetical protein